MKRKGTAGHKKFTKLVRTEKEKKPVYIPDVSDQEILAARWPTVLDLKRQFTDYKKLIQGEYARDIYNQPLFRTSDDGSSVLRYLVSRGVRQGTLGILRPGDHFITPSEQERILVVLSEQLEARVGNNPAQIVVANKDITIPCNTSLTLTALRKTFYFCRYLPLAEQQAARVGEAKNQEYEGDSKKNP